MIAHIFINGRRIGIVEYEHPRDERGRIIPTPQKCVCEQFPCACNEVSVMVDGEERQWFAHAKLEEQG